jgi:DNA-binding FadR family transcriptional regulator
MASAPRGLHGVLVRELGRQIADGALPVGTVIVPEEIGRTFEASRPTVREALRVLESKGLLRIRQSLGTRVQPMSEWNLLDAEVVDWRLHSRNRDDQVRELAELRLAVEPVTARLAAMRQDSQWSAAVGTAWERMQEGAQRSDVHAFTEADVEFHAALLRGSGNQMFDRLTDLIATALSAREETLLHHTADISTAALESHHRVFQAVSNGDGDSAEAEMRAMLRALLDESMEATQAPPVEHGVSQPV